MEKDAEEFIEETIEHQSDTVYDYQLDIDCNEMPITIDEISMSVNNGGDLAMDGGNLIPTMAFIRDKYYFKQIL